MTLIYARPWFSRFIVIIPAIVYFIHFSLLSINVPVGDDFIVIMTYLVNSDAAPTWTARWHLLFSEFIEHRLVFTRLSAHLVRGLLGTLDLRAVMLIGNGCLLGITYLFYKVLRYNKLSAWYLLPVALLLFQPIAYESNFWAISSTNYMPVCFLSMLTFYCLSRSNGYLPAILTALGATFTFANGLLVWPIGALILLSQQRFRVLAGWLLVAVLAIAYYYYDFNYPNRPDMVGNLTHRFSTVLDNFFLLTGAIFNPIDTPHYFAQGDRLPYAMGVVIVGLLVATSILLAFSPFRLPGLTWTQALSAIRDRPFLWASALFLVATCGVFAIGRTYDDIIITDSRYRNFTVFTIAVVYVSLLLILPATRQRIYLIGCAVACLFFYGISYWIYTPRLITAQNNLKAGVFNWKHNHHWLIYEGAGYFGQNVDSISGLIEHTAQWYQFPDFFPQIEQARRSTQPVPIWMTSVDSLRQTIRIQFENPGLRTPYLWLDQNDRGPYLLAVKTIGNVRNLLHTGQWKATNITWTYNYGRRLPQGRYRLRLYMDQPNEVLDPPSALVLNSYRPNTNNRLISSSGTQSTKADRIPAGAAYTTR